MNPSELIEQLPPDLQKEVMDFAEFLLEKCAGRKAEKMHELPWFNQGGAFKGLGDQNGSAERQGKILERRSRENPNEANAVLEFLL